LVQNTTALSNLNVSGTTILFNYVLIGSGPATNILQNGKAGRLLLRIGNGSTDYTLIGTLDTDNNTTNTNIFLNGNTCNTAGAPGYIQYWATASGGHVFYTATGEKMRINDANTTTFNGALYMGRNDSYPDLRLGSSNGNNLGIATNASGFSSSSAAGDMALRTINRLILKSGGGSCALLIDSNNYVYIYNKLIFAVVANIHNGSPQGVANMQSGSLTISGTSAILLIMAVVIIQVVLGLEQTQQVY
jgi:hypothetical protein